MRREQIAAITERVITQASTIEDMLKEACKSISNQDHILAHAIIFDREPTVNRTEADIESTCIEYLALYQPEAVDLRTIVALLKINNALERIADHIVNIVQRLGSFDSMLTFQRLKTMFEDAQTIFHDGMSALAGGDSAKAQSVIAMDLKMDENLIKLTEEVMSFLREKPRTIKNAISALLIGRDLERVADITTNIAEDTIYMVQGEVTKRGTQPETDTRNHYYH
jgi:phosphate transport system protein